MEPHAPTPSAATAYNIQIQALSPSRNGSARTLKKHKQRVRYEEQTQEYARTSDALTFEAWEAPLCGCWCTCGSNAFMATFCPCVSAAQVAARLGIWTYEMALLLFVGIAFCLTVCVALIFSDYSTNSFGGVGSGINDSDLQGYAIAAGLLLLMFFILVARLRWTTRRRFRIPGNKVLDCALSIGCSSCTLAQMGSHLKSYDPRGCDFGPMDVLPAFDAA